MKNRKLISGLLLVALAIAGLLYGFGPRSETESAPPALPEVASATLTDATPTSVQPDSQALPPGLVEQLALQFLERYGDSIDHPATQAKLLGELQTLLGTYPAQGQALFEAAVALAFPELKDAILSLVARLVLYHQWLDDNYRALQAMTLLERQGAIWQKRQEMFGEDANLIWAAEVIAMNKKQEAVKQELQRLDQAFEIPPEEAIHQLQTAIDDVYGNGLERQFIGPDVVASALFSLEAVQAQLQSLPAEDRQPRINSLRKQMGFSDETIAKLETRDQQRNERWEKGFEYMAEREQLARQYSGNQLNQELERLREKHFGRAAKTIAREEQDGFFRFNRPRRLGLN